MSTIPPRPAARSLLPIASGLDYVKGAVLVGEPCRVCGEPTSQYSHASCDGCGETFHLALRQDIPAKDCGQVWINDEFMALEFSCNVCLDVVAPDTAAPPLPPVESVPGAPTVKRRYARRDGINASALLRDKRRRVRG